MTRTLDDLPWPVSTQRLLIRRVQVEDADALWRYRRLPEVCDWITSAPDDADAFVAYFSDPHRLEVTLAVEHDGIVVGDLYLGIEDAWAQTEVKEAARGVQAEIG